MVRLFEDRLMIRIGQPDRWWNYKLPMLRLGTALTVVIAGLCFWSFYGAVVEALTWGVIHQRTVHFRGQTLKVPWFWHVEEWTNYNEFELTRRRQSFPHISSVGVRYMNSSPDSVPDQIERMRKSEKESIEKIRAMGYLTVEPDRNFARHEFTKRNWDCVDQSLIPKSFLHLTCYSLDGRWIVWLLGDEKHSEDFEMILRGVAMMGNPNK